MNEVYIGIGGNIGDRKSRILAAVDSLSTILTDLKSSRFYKTEPRDYFEQDYFLNIVVRGKTDLSPLEFLKMTQLIEKGGGRERDKKIPKGPRTIDLDILLWENLSIDTSVLKIPHPSIIDRRFVLIPLLELNPLLYNDVGHKYYYEYLETVEKQGVYCYSLNDYNNLFL